MKTRLVLCLVALALTGCGKTLDQLKQTAHDLIDIGGKVYEDVKENVEAVKKAVNPPPAPPE